MRSLIYIVIRILGITKVFPTALKGNDCCVAKVFFSLNDCLPLQHANVLQTVRVTLFSFPKIYGCLR